ncbi:hypothetical protein [Microvirga puerhi]|uniref:Uncharacterized protein n=1 Tax=Microvirga puerhi TaxID=2876078 RepID=A0ABS7VN64_9HYPH|nr:hypothetical protein [Microvirga puerhi]MBZ6076545.1 hypothetical protein [Microvirga puerhi]
MDRSRSLVTHACFEDELLEAILAVCWWDRNLEKITCNPNAVRGVNLDTLKRAA